MARMKTIKPMAVVEPANVLERVTLELSGADRVLLAELLLVAQSHLLEVAAAADARKVVNPKLPPRLREWAQRAAGFAARLQAGA
jgi:hypothetical protein